MPAAAVIPAPIAYIKVVAVKKFVVVCERVPDFAVCTQKSVVTRAASLLSYWVAPGLD